jgi:hypothetical protein
VGLETRRLVMKTKQVTALVRLALLVVALTILALGLSGGAARDAQGQGLVLVGFDMDPTGNSCPGDGTTDCTLGNIDACVEVPSGGARSPLMSS